ncbi:MAG: hypothetical protein ACRES5_26125, partial [Pseudomonas sp.]
MASTSWSSLLDLNPPTLRRFAIESPNDGASQPSGSGKMIAEGSGSGGMGQERSLSIESRASDLLAYSSGP